MSVKYLGEITAASFPMPVRIDQIFWQCINFESDTAVNCHKISFETSPKLIIHEATYFCIFAYYFS